ncbi:MAG: phenylalanine--tRNA ligase subunit alpha [Nanoarchaeota archaeon]
MQDIAERLSPLEKRVLPILKEGMKLEQIQAEAKLTETEALRALQLLENKKLLKLNSVTKEIIKIDSNGRIYAKNGLPERQFVDTLRNKILTLKEIKEKTKLSDEELSIALGVLKGKNALNLKKEKEIKINLNENGLKLLEHATSEELLLKKISEKIIGIDELTEIEKNAFENLRKRKNIIKSDVIKEIKISLTDLGREIKKIRIKENYLEVLDSRILKNKSWKGRKFRKYDIKISVPKLYPTKRHFVNEAVDYIRRIWLDLGFKEMTGNIIQTAFWNFDALFVPQDHPARDLQDTLFVKGKYGRLPDKKIVNAVKNAHENGGNTGSFGWQYKWDPKESERLLLRTHTTVLSAETIAKLKESNLPAKFFAVSKVFRNETVDWKHSFEFIQSEGIVIDKNADFKHLLGYLREFFDKMGFKKIRFRPSFFAFTEPSLEVDVWHPERKEWIETAGAGIFRPEVVKPLFGIEVPVLAWGIGVDRAIVDYYNIKDIRELHKNNLKFIRNIKAWLK